jgi:hypothetical protein
MDEMADRPSGQAGPPRPGKLTLTLDEQQLRAVCREMSKRFEAYRAQLNAHETTMKERRR